MLNQLLSNLGHQPTTQTDHTIKYRSPFNPSEKTPSFFVFRNQKWNGEPLREYNYKDYSSGNGGNIFDFVMRYFNIDFKSAKKRVEELLNCSYTNPTPTQNNSSFNQLETLKSYKIVKTQSLQNKALLDYLKERGISPKNSKKYLGEIYYKQNDKSYFALSFGNNSGGREVRNKYFKGSFGKKDISLILPNPKDRRLKYFEGFMDFLSYLEINKKAPLSNYLILNSVSLKERALRATQGKFEAHELYLDNDRAGDETTAFFMENLQNITDKRVHYKEHKDLNEFHLSRRI